MGTLFTITLFAPDAASAKSATDAAFAKIAALDRMMTDYDPESELMQLCKKPTGQPVRVSDELFDVLRKAQRVAELSDGAFDVTVGPVVRLWRRARRMETLPAPDQLARARESVGWKKLKLEPATKMVTLTVPNMQLDLGGIGKGFAADQALEVLKEHGVRRALVAASGDIAAGDPPPGKRGWRVGIGGLGGTRSSASPSSHGESGTRWNASLPNEPVNSLAGVILLRNAAVSTSGDREQFVEIDGKRYSHIVDPRTGIGVTERLQVSVIAKRGVDSDSFDTAINVLGVERGLALLESQPGLAALILRKKGDQTEVIESRRFRQIPRAE